MDRAPSTFPASKIFHRSFYAMHTRFSMVLPGIDPEHAEALAVFAHSELQQLEHLMSRFDAESPISAINRHVAESAVSLSPELWEVMTLCRDYGVRTNGAFDITQWPLNRLWRNCLERGEEPDATALAETRQQCGMQRVEFDDTAHTLRFQNEGMSIDLGGFGKGFALERIVNGLRNQGVDQAFLSFGESSISVLGAHPHGSAWGLGIANLFDPSQTVHTFSLQDASLSSSGTAPFNSVGGPRIFGNIVDPHTGRPIEGYRTMSVASPSATEAEVLSTALLVTPDQERGALLSRFSALEAVEIVYHPNEGNFIPSIHWRYEL